MGTIPETTHKSKREIKFPISKQNLQDHLVEALSAKGERLGAELFQWRGILQIKTRSPLYQYRWHQYQGDALWCKCGKQDCLPKKQGFPYI